MVHCVHDVVIVVVKYRISQYESLLFNVVQYFRG